MTSPKVWDPGCHRFQGNPHPQMGVSVFSPAACNFGATIFFTVTIFSGNRSILVVGRRFGKARVVVGDESREQGIAFRQGCRTRQPQFLDQTDALNIDIICANSSPAKGRVERANKTLQDRGLQPRRLI